MNNDLNKAIIIPNKTAAGVKLGASNKTLKKLWGEPLNIEKISSNDEKWEYQNVNFWIESNKVTQIEINNLYEGQTKEEICLGCNQIEIENVYGPLIWSGTWHIQSPPFGIGFDFERDITGNYVTSIFVFNE